MAENGWTCLEMAVNGCKWQDLADNDKTWLKMAGNGKTTTYPEQRPQRLKMCCNGCANPVPTFSVV